MKFDVEKVLLEICDGNEDILRDDVDLVEDGYLDSYAFILLFEKLEEAGIDISPTQIKKDDLRSVKSIKKAIEIYTNEN